MAKNKPTRKPPSAPDNSENHQILHQQFSGPLPPPAALNDYESTLPGAAERIMALAEGEAAHRRDIETMTRKAEIRLAKGEHHQVYLGQIFAFIVTLALVIGAVFLIYHDKPIGGTLLAGGSAIIIVLAFLRKKTT